MKRTTRLAVLVSFLLPLLANSQQGRDTLPARNTNTRPSRHQPVAVAQEVIEYDVSAGRFSRLPPHVREGSAIIISYKGINRYAASANTTITSGNRSYDDGLSQLQDGLQKSTTAKDKAKEQSKDTTGKSKLTTAAANKLDTLVRYLGAKSTILGQIESEFKKIKNEILKVNAIMAMDSDIVAAANDPGLKTTEQMNAAIFAQGIATGVTAPGLFTSQLNTSITAINQSISSIRGKMTDLKNNLAILTSKDATKESDKLDQELSDIEKRLTEIENAYSGQNLKTIQGNAANMARTSTRLLNQDFTLPGTKIGFADGDYVDVSDRLSDNSGKLITEIGPLRINTYGGRRIDFSIGLSVIIGGQGKYGYDLRKNPTNATSGSAVDSVILVTDDKDRLFQFSPTIFVHWYKTTTCGIQWMFTSGLTPDIINLNDSRVSLGTSVGFPASNLLSRRLVLSAGITFGYADVLKSKFKNLSDYRSFGDLNASDLTRKAIKAGAFVGVSYNLGGVGHN
jgi:hypothetical protein